MLLRNVIKYLKNKKGFSLIEMATALAVMGIISGVVFYNFTESITMSQVTQRKREIETIKKAVGEYYSTYKQWPNAYSFTVVDPTHYISNIASKLGVDKFQGSLATADSRNTGVETRYALSCSATSGLTLLIYNMDYDTAKDFSALYPSDKINYGGLVSTTPFYHTTALGYYMYIYLIYPTNNADYPIATYPTMSDPEGGISSAEQCKY